MSDERRGFPRQIGTSWARTEPGECERQPGRGAILRFFSTPLSASSVLWCSRVCRTRGSVSAWIRPRG